MIIKIFDKYGLECFYSCTNIFNAFDYCYSLLKNDTGVNKLTIVVFIHDSNNSNKIFDVYIDYVNKKILFEMS